MNAYVLKDFERYFRKTYVWLDSVLVPYPLENGLYVLLSPEEGTETLISLLMLGFLGIRIGAPRTFNDWVYGFFDRYIAEKYLVPYNMKLEEAFGKN